VGQQPSAVSPSASAGTESSSEYRRWLQREGLPVVAGHYIPDLRGLELAEWRGRGGSACFINHEQSDQSNDCYVVEIPPGGALSETRHLFEVMFYVLDGDGAASVWNDSGERQTFEWQAGSLFAIPLNAWYQIYNGSGARRARLLAVTNAPTVMNLFADSDFVFECPYVFSKRFDGDADYFSGKGVLQGRIWESNFVPDTKSFPLISYAERGAGGSNVKFKLARNTMWAHISEFPVGTYKKAHRHGPGAHVIILGGQGYTLMWKEGEPIRRYDWQEGSLVIPPDRYFHQHFNTGPTPARYLALRYSAARLHAREKRPMSSVSTKLGGDQIEYEDEDPMVPEMYRNELAANGVELAMSELRQGSRPGGRGIAR
jgi:oxalate decarboxylase/phosphoglucose isomerase-like protein (cupin superfamily)